MEDPIPVPEQLVEPIDEGAKPLDVRLKLNDLGSMLPTDEPSKRLAPAHLFQQLHEGRQVERGLVGLRVGRLGLHPSIVPNTTERALARWSLLATQPGVQRRAWCHDWRPTISWSTYPPADSGWPSQPSLAGIGGNPRSVAATRPLPEAPARGFRGVHRLHITSDEPPADFFTPLLLGRASQAVSQA